MRRRSLIVHVGASKTGTKSIQFLLAAFTPRLARRGIVVPRTDGGNHHNLLLEVARRWTHDPRGTSWRAVEDTIRSSSADTFVLSSELFTDDALGGEPAVARLRELAERTRLAVRVVAYVRPQPERMESWYGEVVRLGTLWRTFDAFAAETLARAVGGPFDYEAMFRPWRDAFGANVAVFPLESGRPAEGLLPHFLGLLGAADPATLRRVARLRLRANVRIGAGDVEVRRRVAELLRGRAEQECRRAMRRLDGLPALLGNDPPFCAFDAPGATAVARHFACSNARFARRYGIDEDGVLFRNPVAVDDRVATRLDWADFDPGTRRAVRAWVRCRIGIDLDGDPRGERAMGGLWLARLQIARFHASRAWRLLERWRQATAVRSLGMLRVWMRHTLTGRWR